MMPAARFSRTRWEARPTRQVCSKVPGSRDGQTELIVRDGLKEHLHKSLNHLSELVGGIRMPPPASDPGPNEEGSSEGGADTSRFARLVDREDGEGSRVESCVEGEDPPLVSA